MSTEQPPQQDPPAQVLWEAEHLRIVKGDPHRRIEVWDAHGDYSPWWEPMDLDAMDALELRRLIRHMMGTLSRQGGRK
ncbi:hypothetical protein [Comamonas sp. JC664]|uniref:hypothetical protein n=1 Tax=Comamonas sp. JC664 TaxID=2801917 RepID=UPI0017496593|nr:hypothetical protein [Comamonas sp. JC664]MBL0698958.1 hypothetical protein [Comamonas sp. JC664]GHG79775.1 hypothetical protein GCM10012319_31970 [Comamonas sp. KCTC 72670]